MTDIDVDRRKDVAVRDADASTRLYTTSVPLGGERSLFLNLCSKIMLKQLRITFFL